MILSGEHVKVNLSSSQWFDILDKFIYKGVEEIIAKSPRYFLQWCGHMLCEIHVSAHKRLFSVDLSTEKLTAELFDAMTCAPADRLGHIKKASFDRIYTLTLMMRYMALCKTALIETDDMIERQRKFEAMKTLELQPWQVAPTLMTVELYDRLASRFIGYISEKYYRLASTRTQAMSAGVKLHISRDDLYANNVLMIVRAIHKYSSKKGTLTNFVIQWMQANNNPRFGHVYGESYSLPHNKRAALMQSNWDEVGQGGAVVNLAYDMDAAVNASVDLHGNREEDASNDDFIHSVASMLTHDRDVRMYMIGNSMPHVIPRAYDLEERSALVRVKLSLEASSERSSGGASVW